MIYTNKEGFISSIKNEKKLKFLNIQTHITEVVRERRRAQPLFNNKEIEDANSFFDRQTSHVPLRTTIGSDLVSESLIQHATSGGLTTMIPEI